MIRYMIALIALTFLSVGSADAQCGARRTPIRNLLRAEVRVATAPLRLAAVPLRASAGFVSRHVTVTRVGVVPVVVPRVMPQPKK